METSVGRALLLSLFAGMSTGIGSLISYFIPRPKPWHLSLLLGFSGGVMLYVSFAELLHHSIIQVGFLRANLGFFIGILFIALIDIIIPHEYQREKVKDSHSRIVNRLIPVSAPGTDLSLAKGGQRRRPASSVLFRTGMLTAIGIAIHNFPEGLAVFSSGITGDETFGIMVAVAIALHNIPEGISVAVPILESTGSRNKAFLYSFVSGLAEPLGALVGYAILMPFLTTAFIYTLVAFAAGVMVFISIDELLPMAHMYGNEHVVIVGTVAGMLLMAVSIYALRMM
ncbi:MAG TPA: zinc transporter ZupT [Dehalococcoidales bacterium]